MKASSGITIIGAVVRQLAWVLPTGAYDFCIRDFKFVDSAGAAVGP